MNEKKTIEIAYITDSIYVLPTRVSITSLIKNSGEDRKYNIHVVGDGLKEDEIKELEELSSLKNNVHVDVLKVENNYGDIYKEHQHVSKAALLKFSLADIFNSLNRIIYLDGDTLILGDIAELFDIDITDYYGAAVSDVPTIMDQKSNDRIGHKNYFNSGVMLLNLSKWRADEVSVMLINEKKKEKWRLFVDQDAFNTVLGEHVKYLPLKYNCIYGETINKPIEQVAGLFHMTAEETGKQIENPVVLHLADKKKPWNNIGADKIELWMKYYGKELDRDTIVLIRSYTRTQEKAMRDELDTLRTAINDLSNRIDNLSNTVAYYRDRTLYGVLAKIRRELFKRWI